MRQLISRFKNRFAVFGKNIFQQQLDTFIRNLPQQKRELIYLEPTVICVGEQTRYWLDVLSRFGVPLFSQPIKRERYITSCFALYGGEVVHFLSTWPKNKKVEQQLKAFYQRSERQIPLSILSRVTPLVLANKDELRRELYQALRIQEHLNIKKGEWRWVLTDASPFNGLSEYVRHCHSNKLPLSLKLGTSDLIQKQLQDLEKQRKQCLVDCSEEAFLIIITGISILIRHIGQIKIGLASAGIDQATYTMKYYFADPELGFGNKTPLSNAESADPQRH